MDLILNSLDFLGYDVRKTMSSTIFGSTNVSDDHENHQTFFDTKRKWGTIGIGIIFMPGIVLLPAVLMVAVNDRNWKVLLALLPIPMYPIIQIGISVYAVVSALMYGKLSSETREYAMLVLGFEAFWESFSQMVLQGYTILYKYDITKVQMITIFASFTLLIRKNKFFHIFNHIIQSRLNHRYVVDSSSKLFKFA